MVSTRFLFAILPFGGALAQDWSGWQEGDYEVVTETITNTKTVCPCDSTSSGWGSWATTSSSTMPYQTWSSTSSVSSAWQSWVPSSSSSSTMPYQSWSSTSSAWNSWVSSSSSMTTSSASSVWSSWTTMSTSTTSSMSTSSSTSSAYIPWFNVPSSSSSMSSTVIGGTTYTFTNGGIPTTSTTILPTTSTTILISTFTDGGIPTTSTTILSFTVTDGGIPTTSTTALSSISTTTTSLTSTFSGITTGTSTISTLTTPSTTATTTSLTTATATPTAFTVQVGANLFVVTNSPGVLVSTNNGDEQTLRFGTDAPASTLELDNLLYLVDPATGEFANIATNTGSDQVYFNNINDINANGYVRLQCTIAAGTGTLSCLSGLNNVLDGGSLTGVNYLFNIDTAGNLYLSSTIPTGNTPVVLTAVGN